MATSFFCAMIAAMSLKFFDPFGTGKLVLFQVTYDKVRWSSEGTWPGPEELTKFRIGMPMN